MKRICIVLTAVFLCLVSCGKKSADDLASPLAKVGGKTYTKGEYEHFSSMSRFFPLRNAQVFPGLRKTISTMIETDLIYASIPGSFKSQVGKSSADWKWRERYYQGQLYMVNILARNMGASEKDVESYYNAHRADSFKTVIKVPVNASADSAKALNSDSSEQATKDSVTYKSLSEVREKIVKVLFLQTFPPDTGYVNRFFGDSIPDSSTVNEQWYQYISRYVRTRDQDFFLKRFYPQVFGHEMPDSIPNWYGDGKPVTQADVDLITQWLPETEQSRFGGERGQRELAKWILRWHVYAEMAKKINYAQSEEVKNNIAWVYKYHVVNEYIDKILTPRLRKGITIDTALATFAFWDDRNEVTIPADSAGLASHIQSLTNRLVAIRLDSLVYGMRQNKSVKFLQADYKDDKDFAPAIIKAKADSLRDSAQAREAEQEYRKLVNEYAFTAEGSEAFTELAKLLTEKQSYKDAIRYYRLQLFHTSDSAKLCNTYFMIGFIYDEYMNFPRLAEENYKWVLRYAPGCELGDDAEFMMLHLDEPMIRIEDLRSEAQRQGRNIDYSDEEPVEQSAAQ